MSPLRLFLFDDALARGWAPFTLTRPAGELLFGSRTLRERAERAFGARCEAHLSRSALLGFDEPGAPPVCAADELGTGGTRVLLSSRAVVEPVEAEPPDDFARLSVGGEPAGWVLPDGAPFPPRE
ncbi:MAG TPA: putative sugar nucleotidyl transferase, partial [Longimicrobiales bacterium]|nr:putative sugar nucleotidyl transferase [Longimicrobiales bacterium]